MLPEDGLVLYLPDLGELFLYGVSAVGVAVEVAVEVAVGLIYIQKINIF
jgi:hypothetical protein